MNKINYSMEDKIHKLPFQDKPEERLSRKDIVEDNEKWRKDDTITKKKDNQSRKEGLKQTISTES